MLWMSFDYWIFSALSNAERSCAKAAWRPGLTGGQNCGVIQAFRDAVSAAGQGHHGLATFRWFNEFLLSVR